jgi:hypothetical protein
LNNHNICHGIDYYGSFLGIQKRFKMNVEDDLEYLTGSNFFLDNIDILMTLHNYNNKDGDFGDMESRKNKKKIYIDEDLQLFDAIDVAKDYETTHSYVFSCESIRT